MGPYDKEFELSFNQMRDNFSSHDFSRVAVSLGVPKVYMHSGNGSIFLHTVALQRSKKIWIKKTAINSDADKPKYVSPIFDDKKLDEETAISFLKNLGYKILKPISEYKEV